jgi:hypothetical protein
VHQGDKSNDGGLTEAGGSPRLPKKDKRLHATIKTAWYFEVRGLRGCGLCISH